MSSPIAMRGTSAVSIAALPDTRRSQNLATVYTDMGDLERAEGEWREVVRAMPDCRPGWRGLSEVLLRTARYQEVQAVAEQCLIDGALGVEGASHPGAARDGEG